MLGLCAPATFCIPGPKGSTAPWAASSSIRSGPSKRRSSRTAIRTMPAPATGTSWQPGRPSTSWESATATAFASSTQAAGYSEAFDLGGVKVTFHPAGHVLGSAQICVEHNGTRIVASGDYKRQPDPTCAPFEPIQCDVFITEATFGLPVFRHPPDHEEMARLLKSVAQFPERSHLIGAYALGKAQRVIRLLRDHGYQDTIYIHGALARLSEYYDSQGVSLGPLEPATVEVVGKNTFAGAIVVGPPSAFVDRWARRFPDPVACFASGWMRIRQRAKQRGVELPLIISDHSDWDELTQTIVDTGASEVWVTHGREEALVRWCEINGILARPLHLVGYEDEGD